MLQLNQAYIVSNLFTIYEKVLLSKYLYSESIRTLRVKEDGAQAGIRTRVLRATAAYTGPNYTTWALSAVRILITLSN